MTRGCDDDEPEFVGADDGPAVIMSEGPWSTVTDEPLEGMPERRPFRGFTTHLT